MPFVEPGLQVMALPTADKMVEAMTATQLAAAFEDRRKKSDLFTFAVWPQGSFQWSRRHGRAVGESALPG